VFTLWFPQYYFTKLIFFSFYATDCIKFIIFVCIIWKLILIRKIAFMNKKPDVTIYDIAEKLGISASTVSRALKGNPAISEKVTKRIQNIAGRMCYQPNVFAANIRRKKTNTIGVLIPRINSEFMSKAIQSIENVLHEAGYNVLISQSDESYKKEQVNARTLFNSRVDGLIVSLANETQQYDHFLPFLKKNIPVVFFDRVCWQINSTRIVIDDENAAFRAVSYLIRQGRKNILIITGTGIRNIYSDRLNGYKKALLKSGIKFDRNLVFESNLQLENSFGIIEEALKMDKIPDGIFCCNDSSAIGCILALKKKKVKIPDDISVVGFNNDSGTVIVEPNLTTISHPVKQMGKLAAEKLLHVLGTDKNSIISETVTLKAKLIIRQSA